MKDKKETPKRGDRDPRVLRDLIINSTEAEIDEALRDAGHDPETVARQTRSIIQQALSASDAARASSQRGFQLFVAFLRRRERLTEEELASKANVSPCDVRRIEFDPSFEPSPRTLTRLETFFDLPSRSLAIMAGAVRVHDREFQQERERFAAMAPGRDKLSSDERELLNHIVEVLAKVAKRIDG